MKEEILIAICGLLFVIVFVFILMSMFQLFTYFDYLQYQEEGYVVRYSFWGYGCEMKIENIDKSTDWRSCTNAGDPFVIENYGVKRK